MATVLGTENEASECRRQRGCVESVRESRHVPDKGMPDRADNSAMATMGKVLSLDQLLALRAAAAREGRSVVQCHGCFDIVHPGHIRHLRQAKSHGDILLVTITSDAAWTKIRGQPLIPEELRAENLAELDCVDWVSIDGHATAAEALEAVRPDVYIKGREYEGNNDPRFMAERETVERHGGRVVFSSGDVIFSSTALIGLLERSVDPYHARLSQLLARPELEGPRLTSLVSGFRGRRVLVVGETIVDEYVLCDRPEVAGESPVLTLRPLERRSYDGGAAVIARHLAALGARPVLLTGLPQTPEAEALTQRLRSEGVDVCRVTTTGSLARKQRFLVGSQKVMKLNLLDPIVLDATTQDQLVDWAVSAADGCDAAIVADFGNGLLSAGMLGRLCPALRQQVRVLTGDVSGRRAGLSHFREMDLVCPSEGELRDAVRNFDDSIPAVVARLLDDTRARAALVTMGPEGLIAFERRGSGGITPGPSGATGTSSAAHTTNPAPAHTPDGFISRLRSEHVPALCGHAVDPLGCGDALLATATLALAAGGGLLAAAFLGSIAAGVQAQRLGNNAISSTDLRHGIVRAHTARLAFNPMPRESEAPPSVTRADAGSPASTGGRVTSAGAGVGGVGAAAFPAAV